MVSVFAKLRSFGVVPVVAVDSVDQGMRLCEALMEGGLPVAEITFRTKAAEEVIRRAIHDFPGMILGAGTILTIENLHRAFEAGASFGVAPGCNPAIIEEAKRIQFPFAPGVCTPTDVELAMRHGARTLKFFPAEACGGLDMLRALIGPYGHTGIEFCPTGGVNAGNMLRYLALPEVAFVGGTWLAKRDLMLDGNWHRITQLTRNAVQIAASR
jgi:2-dehydro-3-deoxyphosphogluconate aldolase/(4S)-4-hydroxy-2-oxoglutarate aldolase